jgi:hypothetical protein
VTTDDGYGAIAAKAYLVDVLAQNPPLHVGDEFSSSDGAHKFRLVGPQPASDPATGFQAMVVAPVVNGTADLSHVIVPFAGTNPADAADVVADAESVVAGKTGPGSQVAQAFAAEVKSQYSTSTISVTGHSLGGYLALYVAAENHWSATTFNGPDPWDVLSPQAKAWLKAQKASGRRPAKRFVGYEGVLV